MNIQARHLIQINENNCVYAYVFAFEVARFSVTSKRIRLLKKKGREKRKK